MVGAVLRYEVGLAWPTAAGTFPWTTLLINTVGCALIGVLMVSVDAFGGHWLVRRTLSTGVLGGFTTFSTYAVDAERLLAQRHPAAALGYLALTVLTCLAAVAAGTALTRRVFARRLAPATDAPVSAR